MCRRWLDSGRSTFPLEVFGDPSLEEDLDQLAAVHDVFGDKVDIPIPIVPQLLIGLLLLTEDLPQVGQVHGGSLAAVEGVAVDVEDLFACIGGGVPSCESRPERMHSVRPVPQTTTS